MCLPYGYSFPDKNKKQADKNKQNNPNIDVHTITVFAAPKFSFFNITFVDHLLHIG